MERNEIERQIVDGMGQISHAKALQRSDPLRKRNAMNLEAMAWKCLDMRRQRASSGGFAAALKSHDRRRRGSESKSKGKEMQRCEEH